MNALLNAARQNVSAEGCVLYTTTFPCHNCARHLISAGVEKVFYIEPFVKSLASKLHYDAIQTELPDPSPNTSELLAQDRMLILPFTGVGPRMYEDYFTKTVSLKNDLTGDFISPTGSDPLYAVRLRELAHVEQAASELL